MSDEVKLSAAWQDVKEYTMRHMDGEWRSAYEAEDVEHARAADAQQIATQQLELQSVANFTDDLKQQIAALRAERDTFSQAMQTFAQDFAAAQAQLTALQASFDAMSAAFGEEKALADRQITRAEAAEDRVIALQAEQAQWQQKAAKIFASINEWCNNDAGLTNEEVVEWRDQLAALTAQQDGSLPTRQPKP